jgi:hypothetical protein
MNKNEIRFMKKVNDYNQMVLNQVKTYLSPAFDNMSFSSPKVESSKNGDIVILGYVYDQNNVMFSYTISFLMADNVTKINIMRSVNGTITRINDNGLWVIASDNPSKLVILAQKHILDNLISKE